MNFKYININNIKAIFTNIVINLIWIILALLSSVLLSWLVCDISSISSKGWLAGIWEGCFLPGNFIRHLFNDSIVYKQELGTTAYNIWFWLCGTISLLVFFFAKVIFKAKGLGIGFTILGILVATLWCNIDPSIEYSFSSSIWHGLCCPFNLVRHWIYGIEYKAELHTFAYSLGYWFFAVISCGTWFFGAND